MAAAEGLEPRLATRVMTAQIEAAKAVQCELFRRWRTEVKGLLPEVLSLTASLRPQISRLSGELIAALIAARDDSDECLVRLVLTPLPDQLARFPQAWALAVDGALDALRHCEGQ